MIDQARLRAFWKRWNHVPDEHLELEKFKTRLNGLLGTVWNSHIRLNPSRVVEFALISGTDLPHNAAKNEYTGSVVCNSVLSTSDLYKIVEMTQFVLWTLEGDDRVVENCATSCRRSST